MSDDGDANVFEIVSSQLGQDLGVNLVLPERLPRSAPAPARRSHAAMSTTFTTCNGRGL